MPTPRNTAPEPLNEHSPIHRWVLTWIVTGTAQGLQTKIIESQSWIITGGRIEFFNRTNSQGGKKIVFVLREQYMITLEEEVLAPSTVVSGAPTA